MSTDEKIDLLLEKVGSMESDIHTLKGDVQALKSDVQILKDDMQSVKDRVTGIEVTLENETNRGIRIVAEGHADLNRRLDEALRVESEKELFLIRVNRMENDISKIKRKLAMT